MAKYKLISLSVAIGGKVYKKEEGTVFDTDKGFKPLKAEIEAAKEAGFLVKLEAENENFEAKELAAEEAKIAAEIVAEEKAAKKAKPASKRGEKK